MKTVVPVPGETMNCKSSRNIEINTDSDLCADMLQPMNSGECIAAIVDKHKLAQYSVVL